MFKRSTDLHGGYRAWRDVAAWIALAGLLCGTGAVQAAIIGTYVDADTSLTGNTVNYPGGQDGTTGGWATTFPTFGSATQWTQRTDLAIKEGPYILENNASTTQSAPEIETTITGLNVFSIYNVYVIYQTNNTTLGGSGLPTSNDWHVNAGLTAGGLTDFDSSNGTYTGNGGTNPSGNFTNEREALVGQVSHVTSASVFVDDDLAPIVSTDNRTRYDGVAYEFAGFTPEPASLSLLGVGGLLLLRRRRGC